MMTNEDVFLTGALGSFTFIAASWVWGYVKKNFNTRRYLEREIDKLSHERCVIAARVKQLDERVSDLEAMRDGPYR
jgi:hypothetical protein